MTDEIDKARIAKLMRAPLGTMSDTEALDSVGELIDAASDARDAAALTRAFEQLRSIERRNLSPANRALVHYFRANAWHGRRLVMAVVGSRTWEQPDRQEQILELFRARNHPGFNELDKLRRCQILTNLGMQFLEVGRFIEAIEIWDTALALLPNFAMALGSRGIGFKYYGLASADSYDHAVLMMTAQRSFAAATAPGVLWDAPYPSTIKDTFRDGARSIAEHYDVQAVEAELENNRPTMGRGRVEQSFRRWCLQQRLFVNVLNDVAAKPFAASDPLMLPSLTVAFETKGVPPVIGLFNQMKQEFAFARLLLFEGVHPGGVHFADRGVRLHNTLDYPAYSIATEKTRTAFRLAYSLLDKVGYFINSYWALGTPVHRVGFRSVWYKDGEAGQGLHARFDGYENWPLLGLFWLSKDLFDDHFQRVTSPDAREIYILRNHLEHKFLQVRQGWATGATSEPSMLPLGYSIASDDLEAKALRILKMARAALVHLALAVHCEEEVKRSGGEDRLVVPMLLTRYEDKWKQPM